MFGRGGPLVLDGGDDVTTDAEGAFTVEGIAPGRVKVTVKSPDYADGSEVADVKETGGTVEIKLAAGGSVGGVVVAGNQPVASANVSLAGAGEAGFGRILGGGQSTTTDATGRFTFDHLDAGRYSVSAGLNGKSSNLAEVVLQAGDARNDLVLSLSAGTTIQGTVSGLPGRLDERHDRRRDRRRVVLRDDEGRRRRIVPGDGRARGARDASRAGGRRARDVAQRVEAGRRERRRARSSRPRSSSTSASRSRATSRARASPSRTPWSPRTCRAAAAGRRRRGRTSPAPTRSRASRRARTPSRRRRIRSRERARRSCGRRCRSRATRTST